ncbi:MAG: hypothetical protein ACPGUV_14800 [Polyangiales bacterium]
MKHLSLFRPTAYLVFGLVMGCTATTETGESVEKNGAGAVQMARCDEVCTSFSNDFRHCFASRVFRDKALRIVPRSDLRNDNLTLQFGDQSDTNIPFLDISIVDSSYTTLLTRQFQHNHKLHPKQGEGYFEHNNAVHQLRWIDLRIRDDGTMRVELSAMTHAPLAIECDHLNHNAFTHLGAPTPS